MHLILYCFQKNLKRNLMSVIHLPAILGLGTAAPILWAPGRIWSFLQETSMSTKFLVLGGCVGSFRRGETKVPILFVCRREEKAYTTTTERKSLGELFWPQRETFQAGGGYENRMKTRKTISTTEIFPLRAPNFFSAKKSSALEQGGVWFLFPSVAGFSDLSGRSVRKLDMGSSYKSTSDGQRGLEFGVFQRPQTQIFFQKHRDTSGRAS